MTSTASAAPPGSVQTPEQKVAMIAAAAALSAWALDTAGTTVALPTIQARLGISVTASQWVTGEPPKDGRLYVVRDRGGVRIVAWCGVSGGWWAGESGLLVATEIREHMLAPISDAPAVSVDGASEWTQGEPPKDGRWYVVALHREGNGYGMPPSLAAWYGGRWVRCDAEPETAVAWHLPTPVPGVPS